MKRIFWPSETLAISGSNRCVVGEGEEDEGEWEWTVYLCDCVLIRQHDWFLTPDIQFAYSRPPLPPSLLCLLHTDTRDGMK